MHVKGTAVKSIQEFVQTRHADKYAEWLKVMPEVSRLIMSKPVYVSDWYSVKDAAIEPTIALGKVVYNGDIVKAGWETGRYSSEIALNGIYKVFVKMATPQFIIARSGKILPSYYDPSDLAVKETGAKHVILNISKLPVNHEVLEARIFGWIQKALEVTGCKNVQINPTKSMAKGDSITELMITWNYRSLDQLKKRKVKFEELNEKIPDEEPVKMVVSEIQMEQLKKAIQQLPDGYRVVLSLYLLEGYDHEEIAQIMGITNVSSRSQFLRAKLKLREMLHKEELFEYN